MEAERREWRVLVRKMQNEHEDVKAAYLRATRRRDDEIDTLGRQLQMAHTALQDERAKVEKLQGQVAYLRLADAASQERIVALEKEKERLRPSGRLHAGGEGEIDLPS